MPEFTVLLANSRIDWTSVRVLQCVQAGFTNSTISKQLTKMFGDLIVLSKLPEGASKNPDSCDKFWYKF